MNLSHWIGPIVGAVIGLCTNYIAVVMLFHPKNEIKVFGHTLPFSPGAIPKEKKRIARSVGDIVAHDLLTQEDIEEKCLKSEDFVIERCMKILDKEIHESLVKALKSEENYQEMLSQSKEKMVEYIMIRINSLDIEKLLMQECMETVDQKIGDSALLRLMSGSVVASLSAPVSQQISNFLNGRAKEMLEEEIEMKWHEWEALSFQEALNALNLNQEKVESELRSFYRNLVHHMIPLVLDQLNIQAVVEEKICEMSNDELEALALKAMKKEFTLIVYLGGLIGFLLGCIQLMIH